MGEQFPTASGVDPLVPNWQTLELPDAWPDGLNYRKPTVLFQFFKQILSRSRKPVSIPEDMPGAGTIPKYILQEFHNLPNGNYSKCLTRGYITGFDMVMLGSMAKLRTEVAEKFKGLHSVVDIGCGGGHMAGALKKAGVSDVWGIDPSPYLLQHAATDYPDIQFVQGIAEQTNFPNQRFDGIAACFLMHELPPKYLSKSLNEFQRILKSDGLLAISEPSGLQLKHGWLELWRRWGWKGWYYRLLANTVHEPFVQAWHKQDIRTMLSESGFELLSDDDDLPIRKILARRL